MAHNKPDVHDDEDEEDKEDEGDGKTKCPECKEVMTYILARNTIDDRVNYEYDKKSKRDKFSATDVIESGECESFPPLHCPHCDARLP